MGKVIIKKKQTQTTSSTNGLKCLNCGKSLSGRRRKFCSTVCKATYYEYGDVFNDTSYSFRKRI